MDRNERKSFVMYASFLEAAEQLDAEAFKECVLKLRDYALFGEEVYSKDPVVNIILTMAKPNISAAEARYQRCVENGNKGKEHGSKGGRPRKGESREAYLERKGKPETPRKPLNADEDENEKENNDVEEIQSPAAMEPARGSGRNTVFSSSHKEAAGPELSVLFATEDASWIHQQVAEMSQSELVERYEHDIDKIALSKVDGRKLNSEGALAMEAALILQRYERLPTLKEAMGVVIRVVRAAVQQIQESRNRQISWSMADDENDQPF